MTYPAENFQCFGVVFDTNNVATCRCPPDRCVASVDGIRLGRVSSISDINCRACPPLNMNHPGQACTQMTGFPLSADDTHRTETFGPLFEYLDATTYEERMRVNQHDTKLSPVPVETDPTGRDPHAPGAKLDAGKCRPGLVLGGFARALWAVSMVGTYGAVKYTEDGWISVPNGQARYDDAGMRHWLKEKMGEAVDPDTELDHAAHAAWNALSRLDLMIRERESKA